MRKRKTAKITYILIVVAVLALLLLVGGFIAKFTNNFTSDFKTFYVEYDGKTITSDKSDINFVRAEPNRINVGYSLGFLNKEKGNYEVEVLPDVTDETDFEYQVNGKNYKFSELTDFTEFYKIEKYDDYFTFTMWDNIDSILAAMYHGDNVSGIPDLSNKSLLKLVIYNEDKTVSISISFKLIVLPNEIIISPDGIQH